MKDRYTEYLSRGLNIVDRDNPNLGIEGQHEHTMDNLYGLHFHADGTLGGVHIHNDLNPLGVHSHGKNPLVSGGHYHGAQAAGNFPSDGSHGHLDDDSPELKEKITPKPSLQVATKASKSKLRFNEDGTIGLDNQK